MNLDFAQNTIKLRRIMDKMPNATSEQIKAEYIRQGGLLNSIDLNNIPEGLAIAKKGTFEEVVKITPKKIVKTVVKKVTKKK